MKKLKEKKMNQNNEMNLFAAQDEDLKAKIKLPGCV